MKLGLFLGLSDYYTLTNALLHYNLLVYIRFQ